MLWQTREVGFVYSELCVQLLLFTLKVEALTTPPIHELLLRVTFAQLSEHGLAIARSRRRLRPRSLPKIANPCSPKYLRRSRGATRSWFWIPVQRMARSRSRLPLQ